MTLISSLLFAGHLFFLLCLNFQFWSGDQLRETNSFVMSLLAIILSQRSVCGWGFHSTDFSWLLDGQIIKEDQNFIITSWLSPIFVYSWPNKNVKHFFWSVHIQFKSVHRKAQHEPNQKCPSLPFAQIWASPSCVLSCSGNWPQQGEKDYTGLPLMCTSRRPIIKHINMMQKWRKTSNAERYNKY